MGNVFYYQVFDNCTYVEPSIETWNQNQNSEQSTHKEMIRKIRTGFEPRLSTF